MSTVIGQSFASVAARLQGAKVVEESSEKGVPFFGDQTNRSYDLDGDGKVDARETISTKATVSRTELTFLDAQGRAVDTFTSGCKVDSFFGLMETGKVWSHTHMDYEASGSVETYETAGSGTTELLKRTVTTRDASGQETVAVERDTNGDGVLESQGTFVLVAGEWVRR